MDEPAYLSLIHAEIDGELDERQRAELSRLLLADPVVRSVRDEMHHLCRAVEGLPIADAPANLHSDIIAALPQNLVSRAPGRWNYGRWRYAAALAGVLLTGTIVFGLLDYDKGTGANEMAGTLAAPRSASTVDVVQLGQGVVSGQVSLVVDGGKVTLELQLAASAPVDVLVSTEGHTARINGLGTQGSQGTGSSMIELPAYAADGRPVNLTFLVGDHEVGRAVLRGPKAP